MYVCIRHEKKKKGIPWGAAKPPMEPSEASDSDGRNENERHVVGDLRHLEKRRRNEAMMILVGHGASKWGDHA